MDNKKSMNETEVVSILEQFVWNDPLMFNSICDCA